MTALRKPTKAKPMTVDEVKAYVVQAVNDSPRGYRNPTSEEACLYDDGKGNHCIAAQVLLNTGIVKKATELREGSTITLAFSEHKNGDRVTWAALNRLEDIQAVFDHFKPRGGSMLATWRDALKECKRRKLA
jgi:hypothetical protein